MAPVGCAASPPLACPILLTTSVPKNVEELLLSIYTGNVETVKCQKRNSELVIRGPHVATVTIPVASAATGTSGVASFTLCKNDRPWLKKHLNFDFRASCFAVRYLHSTVVAPWVCGLWDSGGVWWLWSLLALLEEEEPGVQVLAAADNGPCPVCWRPNRWNHVYCM
jgi:hypothetical protein